MMQDGDGRATLGTDRANPGKTTDAMNRQERRAARKEGDLDTTGFLKVADKFIDLANRENQRVKATQLHMAFLFASARYSAFVGKTMIGLENHEEFVEKMTGEYRDMLRQHLADKTLDGSAED